MKKSIQKLPLLAISMMAALLVSGCQKSESPEPSPEALSTIHQKVLYIRSYKRIKKGVANGAIFDQSVMARAIYDAQNGIPSKIPKSEHSAIMSQLKKEVRAKKIADKMAKAPENAKKGAYYLTDNAKKEGVIVTESGLQYRVLTAVEGDAPKPKPESKVKAHYKGSLIDGRVFKNTFGKRKAANFVLNEVIDGWTEGLQLMKVGEKFEFVIPSYLAYGEKGVRKGLVGPNATLVFEIELLEIETPEK